MVIGNVDVKASRIIEKRLQWKEKAAERRKNFQFQDIEKNTANKLSPSVMEHILDSSNSSNENEDNVSEYKQRETNNTIRSQDSPQLRK
jgi:hypothetical protein